MTPTEQEPEKKAAYGAPCCRMIPLSVESAFLQSNTEPIGGGDNPDIDW